MKEMELLRRQFDNVMTVQPHRGYYYQVKDALIIAILGSLCGLSDMKDIHQWSDNSRVREFLTQTFNMNYFPCYSWFTLLMRLVDSQWLNQQFTVFWQQLLPEDRAGITVSVDGKNGTFNGIYVRIRVADAHSKRANSRAGRHYRAACGRGQNQ
jgi:hypothetical protein